MRANSKRIKKVFTCWASNGDSGVVALPTSAVGPPITAKSEKYNNDIKTGEEHRHSKSLSPHIKVPKANHTHNLRKKYKKSKSWSQFLKLNLKLPRAHH